MKQFYLFLFIGIAFLTGCESSGTMNVLASGQWTVTEAYRGSIDASSDFTSSPHTIRFLTNRTYDLNFPSQNGFQQGNYIVRGSELLITPNSTGIQETWEIVSLSDTRFEAELQLTFLGQPVTYRLVMTR